MKKVYFVFIPFFFFCVLGCSSLKNTFSENNQNESTEVLDYTDADVVQNEIQNIRKIMSSEPTKALWRAVLLGDESIKKECIDLCFIQLDLAIEEKNYFEAKNQFHHSIFPNTCY